MNKLFFWFLLFTVFCSVRAAFQDHKVDAERSADALVRISDPTLIPQATSLKPLTLWEWPAQICALLSEMPNALLWLAFGTGIMVVVCIAWSAWRIADDRAYYEGWQDASENNIRRGRALAKRREELGLDEPVKELPFRHKAAMEESFNKISKQIDNGPEESMEVAA